MYYKNHLKSKNNIFIIICILFIFISKATSNKGTAITGGGVAIVTGGIELAIGISKVSEALPDPIGWLMIAAGSASIAAGGYNIANAFLADEDDKDSSSGTIASPNNGSYTGPNIDDPDDYGNDFIGYNSPESNTGAEEIKWEDINSDKDKLADNVDNINEIGSDNFEDDLNKLSNTTNKDELFSEVGDIGSAAGDLTDYSNKLSSTGGGFTSFGTAGVSDFINSDLNSQLDQLSNIDKDQLNDMLANLDQSASNFPLSHRTANLGSMFNIDSYINKLLNFNKTKKRGVSGSLTLDKTIKNLGLSDYLSSILSSINKKEKKLRSLFAKLKDKLEPNTKKKIENKFELLSFLKNKLKKMFFNKKNILKLYENIRKYKGFYKGLPISILAYMLDIDIIKRVNIKTALLITLNDIEELLNTSR